MLLDTADTLSVLNTDSDVTLITPPGVPRVLDEVVRSTIQSTVTNSEDGVVKRVTTGGSSDDTRVVVLVDRSVSLNGDGNGLLVKSGLELGGGVSFNGGVAGGTNTTSVRVLLARTVFASVSVVRLVGESVALGILVGIVLPATVATIVTVSGAVNELLLGERDKFTSLDEVSTFETTSGGESPAGTTRTLILDRGDSTSVDPVNAGGEVGLFEDFLFSEAEAKGSSVTEESFVLSLSPVRHVVVSKSPGGVGVVVGHDVGFSFHVTSHSEFEFLAGTVGSTPFVNPFHESGLVGSNSSD